MFLKTEEIDIEEWNPDILPISTSTSENIQACITNITTKCDIKPKILKNVVKKVFVEIAKIDNIISDLEVDVKIDKCDIDNKQQVGLELLSNNFENEEDFTQVKNHKCDLCDKPFSCPDVLMSHMKSVHEEISNNIENEDPLNIGGNCHKRPKNNKCNQCDKELSLIHI